MSALDLLVRSIKSQKWGRPFYSKMDEALENLPRQKGTVEEFMKELEKQPGVKKAEIEDRRVRKALSNRAKSPGSEKPITKAELQKIFSDQAPMPPVVEDFLGGKDVQYKKYSTPGGKNYREILLKLPEDYLSDPYFSDHFGDNPNILAHIRVSDFTTPDGKKVLLVDEIQSDWHQAGRKEGYKSGNEKNQIKELADEYDKLTLQRRNLIREAEEMNNTGPAFLGKMDEIGDITPKLMRLQTQMDELRLAADRGVPDAPFKKNWHELAMKRVLDYAAELGYDTVAITPGMQQVKRYEDATRKAVDEVAMYGDTLVGFKDGRRVIEQPISSPDELEKYVGKDIAQKLSSAAPDMNFIRSVKGEDLTVGGEGMKGFYDKILPDYLNNYGKKYGAQVGELDLITKPESKGVNIMTPDEPEIYPAETMRFHSIDITPQMRMEINTKGQPLYSKIGVPGAEATAGAGAATIGSQVFGENNEQGVQNPVHFTENPDAMLLELMQRN